MGGPPTSQSGEGSDLSPHPNVTSTAGTDRQLPGPVGGQAVTGIRPFQFPFGITVSHRGVGWGGGKLVQREDGTTSKNPQGERQAESPRNLVP